MSEPVKVPLSGTEEAFVAIVLEEHAALVRAADQKRDSRMAVLLAEKAIPANAPVRVEREGDGPAHLVYTP